MDHPNEEIAKAWAFILDHKWVPLAAVVIGLVVRLLKSDTKIPVDIPPRWRALLALGLGVAGGILERVASGSAWSAALTEGVTAAMLAITGHAVIVDAARGGKELVVPGLIKPGVPPGPGKPPSIPPKAPPPAPPPTSLMMMMILVAAFFCTACSKVVTALDLAREKAACVAENASLPDEVIIAKCVFQPGDFERYRDLLAASRESAKRAAEKAAAERCAQGSVK